jgi:hypothetical protein
MQSEFRHERGAFAHEISRFRDSGLFNLLAHGRLSGMIPETKVDASGGRVRA